MLDMRDQWHEVNQSVVNWKKLLRNPTLQFNIMTWGKFEACSMIQDMGIPDVEGGSRDMCVYIPRITKARWHKLRLFKSGWYGVDSNWLWFRILVCISLLGSYRLDFLDFGLLWLTFVSFSWLIMVKFYWIQLTLVNHGSL